MFISIWAYNNFDTKDIILFYLRSKSSHFYIKIPIYSIFYSKLSINDMYDINIVEIFVNNFDGLNVTKLVECFRSNEENIWSANSEKFSACLYGR